MDCIRIINLKIPARHGVYDLEKDKDGLFELDVELFLDLSIAGRSDLLSDTVDYDELIALITDVFTRKDHNLIESAGEDISSELLSNYPVDRVMVRIRKPHAPIMANLDTVEVEVIREK
ncbi:MAG: dihydroneopterin aldolase [Candidatus Marinimicrobia bacterium]|nr:dihydroneopterin aldolase [Candidatus Neomarinimicrobiota bacterium]|tara:strand:- start:9879 stop:10235 length:357 start_codon:yes stop_codon:yes gene_type:complete